jgi:hypothetical protein
MSFAGLGWAIRREAALHILYPGITQAPSLARVVLAGKSAQQLARLVTYKLNHRWHRGGTFR